jgi:hypothetical protein
MFFHFEGFMKKIIILCSLFSVVGILAIDRTELEDKLAKINAKKAVYNNRREELREKVVEMSQGKEALLCMERFEGCKRSFGGDVTPCNEQIQALFNAFDQLDKTLEYQKFMWRCKKIERLDEKSKWLLNELQTQASVVQ